MERSIHGFFEPKSIAIIGASSTPGKAGNQVIHNILANEYPGKLYLVNPRGGEILGIPVHQSIDDLPESIDLAIVLVSAGASPQALRDCARKGIHNFVLAAGGFAEIGELGAVIQQELNEIIQETGVRVLGPNTSGHISTPSQVVSSFFPLGKIRHGTVSYIAQTGNFATHTMRHILTFEHFGVARVIGLGNKIDIDESDALEYLADDPETSAIVMYLESISRPRRFLEIARNLTREKPIVMLKSGSTEAGQNAATAHTAAMAVEDRIVDGLLRQAGVARIWDYTHLILAGKALSMVPLPKGNRIGVLATSGALCVTLADLCVRLGLEIPELEPESLKRLQEMSAPFISIRNPIDIWAITFVHDTVFGYREAMETVLRDPNIDAVVSLLLLLEATGVPSGDFIIDLAERYPEKPILVGYTGDKDCIEEFRRQIEPEGIPSFLEIEQPFEVLSILVRCREAMNRTM